MRPRDATNPSISMSKCFFVYRTPLFKRFRTANVSAPENATAWINLTAASPARSTYVKSLQFQIHCASSGAQYTCMSIDLSGRTAGRPSTGHDPRKTFPESSGCKDSAWSRQKKTSGQWASSGKDLGPSQCLMSKESNQKHLRT